MATIKLTKTDEDGAAYTCGDYLIYRRDESGRTDWIVRNRASRISWDPIDYLWQVREDLAGIASGRFAA